MRRAAGQHGSVYLATLGASMIVTILGVSALMAVKAQRDAAALDQDAGQAALLARSAIEVALRDVQNNANWRNTRTHDQWTAPVTLGRGSYRYKFVSTAGNALNADPDQPVRVVGRGELGEAVRLESVLLDPIDLRGTSFGDNILNNPSFDGNTDDWSLIAGTINLVLDLLTTRTPPGALTVTGRNSPDEGIAQDVTHKLINGMTYQTGIWARLGGLLASDSVRIRLVVRSTGGPDQTFATGAASVNGLLWQQATGTLTPTWEGSLIEARWEVVTVHHSYNITFDDANLTLATSNVRPHAIDDTSWRQELP